MAPCIVKPSASLGLSLVSFVALAGRPDVVLAQSPSPSAVGRGLNLPFNELQLNVIRGSNLFDTLNRILGSVLLILGVLAFLYLIYAGFNYLTAGGDPAKPTASLSTIVNVVIGI